MVQFIAIDVETANADRASICQIGLVGFDLDGPVSSWQTLVNPEDAFDAMNVSIHGITEKDVRDAPKLPEVYDHLCAAIAGAIAVGHTVCDRVAVHRAFDKVRPSTGRLSLAR
jgi:DNA polymerase-3 subunit epsilon